MVRTAAAKATAGRAVTKITSPRLSILSSILAAGDGSESECRSEAALHGCGDRGPVHRAWPGLAEDLFLSKNGGKLWEIVKYPGRKYSTCAGECKSRGSV